MSLPLTPEHGYANGALPAFTMEDVRKQLSGRIVSLPDAIEHVPPAYPSAMVHIHEDLYVDAEMINSVQAALSPENLAYVFVTYQEDGEHSCAHNFAMPDIESARRVAREIIRRVNAGRIAAVHGPSPLQEIVHHLCRSQSLLAELRHAIAVSQQVSEETWVYREEVEQLRASEVLAEAVAGPLLEVTATSYCPVCKSEPGELHDPAIHERAKALHKTHPHLYDATGKAIPATSFAKRIDAEFVDPHPSPGSAADICKCNIAVTGCTCGAMQRERERQQQP